MSDTTSTVKVEYDDWLRGAAATYLKLGRAREAGYVFLYLHQFPQALQAFTQAEQPVEVDDPGIRSDAFGEILHVASFEHGGLLGGEPVS